MRIFLSILVSSLAALAVQPFVLFIWFFLPALLRGAVFQWHRFPSVAYVTMLVAAPFVLSLGVALTAILLGLGRLKWWPLALVGAVVGCILGGWNGPGSGGGQHGEPTLEGWLSYLLIVAGFALHGLIGATVFYAVCVRLVGPDNLFKSNPPRGSAKSRRWISFRQRARQEAGEKKREARSVGGDKRALYLEQRVGSAETPKRPNL